MREKRSERAREGYELPSYGIQQKEFLLKQQKKFLFKHQKAKIPSKKRRLNEQKFDTI